MCNTFYFHGKITFTNEVIHTVGGKSRVRPIFLISVEVQEYLEKRNDAVIFLLHINFKIGENISSQNSSEFEWVERYFLQLKNRYLCIF